MARVLVLGAGIGGLAAAVGLRDAGHEVSLFEAAERIEPLGAGIALQPNAVLALRALGIEPGVLAAGNEIAGVSIRSADGRPIVTTEIKALSDLGVGVFTFHRAELHRRLIEPLPEGILCLDRRAQGVEATATGVTVRFADGSHESGDAVVAADGIHSVVRRALVPGSDPIYSGVTCWRSVTDERPAGIDACRATELWGEATIFGIVPLTGGRVYWYAGVPAAREDDARFRAFRVADLLAEFRGFPAAVRALLGVSRDERLIWTDLRYIRPLRRFAFGRVALLGDAAHAMTPYLGQGACQALEDAAMLARCARDHADLVQAFAAYGRSRVARARGFQRGSLMQLRMAHLRRPWLRALRDGLLRRIPESSQRKRINQVLAVEF